MTPKTAVVAGHICVDFIPGLGHVQPGQFSQLFQPGRLVVTGAATFSTGGPVSNTGLTLHRLGIPTRLVARVGSDPFARIVLGIVESYDPALSEGFVISDSATSYTVIINPPGTDRTFLHHPGSNDTFEAADVNLDLVRRADLFHFGYPPMMRQMYVDGGAGLVEMLKRVKATGATTSLDMVFPDPTSAGGQADWRAILSAALPYVDIFVPSIEEMLFMLHRERYEQMAAQAPGGDILPLVTPALLSDFSDELMGWGVKILALKLGARGIYLRTAGVDALAGIGRAAPMPPQSWAERELWAPCFQVQVAGNTGAGDAAIAGLLSGLLRGLGAEESLTAAVAVGACNVEAPDALSGVRTWEQTLDRIHSGWPRLPLDIQSPGWRWDSTASLFRGPTNH